MEESSMDRVVIKNGSLDNSGQPIVLVENDRTWDNEKQPCPHCHSPIKIIHTRSFDLTTWEEISWTNPFVALIPYDGDCCQTAICVKCLLDGIEKSNFDIGSIKEEVIKEFENIPTFTKIETCLLKKDGFNGAEGCIWTKGSMRLGYLEKEGEGWNLNGKPVEFMEEIPNTQ